jgi:F0F1-type ATP synthase membrane subunit c/vacuolar-type H+-ATPase subunit K
MDLIISALHYTAAVAALVLPAIGVSIAQGRINSTTLNMLQTQPQATNAIRKIYFISSAVIEATMIIALIISMMLSLKVPGTVYQAIAHCGIIFAIGICGFVIGICSAQPAQNAIIAIAREPFEHTKMMNLVLITLSLIQTPVIFGFIISWVIIMQSAQAQLSLALTLLASGIVMGIGAIGPIIGLSSFAQASCKSIGINKRSYAKIISFTFISQALIETPILFSFLIGLLLATLPAAGFFSPISGYKALASAFAMGLSTIGTGIASGNVSGAACTNITLYPDKHPMLSKISLLGQVFVDTNAIYGFIIALIITFV